MLNADHYSSWDPAATSSHYQLSVIHPSVCHTATESCREFKASYSFQITNITGHATARSQRSGPWGDNVRSTETSAMDENNTFWVLTI